MPHSRGLLPETVSGFIHEISPSYGNWSVHIRGTQGASGLRKQGTAATGIIGDLGKAKGLIHWMVIGRGHW